MKDERQQLGTLEDAFQKLKNTTGLSDVNDIIERQEILADATISRLELVSPPAPYRVEW